MFGLRVDGTAMGDFSILAAAKERAAEYKGCKCWIYSYNTCSIIWRSK